MNQKIILTITFVLLFIANLYPQESNKIKSLSIFKNGQSFVRKEINVIVKDNTYKMDMLPNALFGSLWFKGISLPITSVSAKVENFVEKRERKANTFLELLYANKGKSITINTSDNHTFKGIIEDFELPEEINSKLHKIGLNDDYESGYRFDHIFDSASITVLLKMDGKWVSIAPNTIHSIEFTDKPNRSIAPSIAIKKPIVTLHFPKDGLQSLDMIYLQNGIFWTPTYKINLLSDNQAQLEMQIEVSNDVETITNADVDFGIGVPNFTSTTSLATLIDFPIAPSLSPDPINKYYSNSVYQKISDSSYGDEISKEEISLQDVKDNVSSENEDLYFYTIKNVTIEKGERAQFTIFSSPVKIRHYYKSFLPVSNIADYHLPYNTQDGVLNNNDNHKINVPKATAVSHFIEIENSTPSPLTSGSMLVLQKDNQTALAQSTLYFTPKGSNTELFITNSPDIGIKDSERMVEIKKDTLRFNNSIYTLAKVNGKISINNSKSKSVTMKIQKAIMGKAISASVKYEQNSQLNTNSVNSYSQFSFEVELKAGERKEITYTYNSYILNE